MTALDAQERFLAQPVFGTDVVAGVALARRIPRIDAQQFTALPRQLVCELSIKLPPPLVLHTPIETRFCRDVRAWIFNGPFGRSRHVDDAQVFFNCDRVVFADRAGSLVDLILSDVGDFRVQLGDPALDLHPILGEPHAARERLLQDRQARFPFFEGVCASMNVPSESAAQRLTPRSIPTTSPISG
jgi:hypothetical protein